MNRLDTISKIIPNSLPGLRIGSRNLSSIISSLRHSAAELHIVELALKSPNTLRIVGVSIRHNLRSVSTYERTIAMLRRSVRTIARTRKSLRDMNAYMEDAAPQAVGLVRDALLQLDIREEQLLKHLAKDEADLEDAIEKIRAAGYPLPLMPRVAR